MQSRRMTGCVNKCSPIPQLETLQLHSYDCITHGCVHAAVTLSACVCLTLHSAVATSQYDVEQLKYKLILHPICLHSCLVPAAKARDASSESTLVFHEKNHFVIPCKPLRQPITHLHFGTVSDAPCLSLKIIKPCLSVLCGLVVLLASVRAHPSNNRIGIFPSFKIFCFKIQTGATIVPHISKSSKMCDRLTRTLVFLVFQMFLISSNCYILIFRSYGIQI